VYIGWAWSWAIKFAAVNAANTSSDISTVKAKDFWILAIKISP
jgi:hypothetical protein